MKIVTVVGARPQFIKAAALSRVLRNRDDLQEIIVHTGQHFDANMSEVFFRQMEIPEPDYNIDVAGLNHGAMTGRMLERIEQVLLKEQPYRVLVYGDTNSTLAGALAAAKLHIPVAHVEAGLRSFNRRMPEEINRVLTDHVSDILFVPTVTAMRNLKREGIPETRIHLVGDVMQDAALYYVSRAQCPHIPEGGICMDSPFALATLHRAENTDDLRRITEIFSALAEISSELPLLMPIHPRTRMRLAEAGIDFADDPSCSDRFCFIDPVGYLEMIFLLQKCRIVLTDSGGLQKEAFFFRKPCVTLRDETEWIELVDAGANRLAGSNKKQIIGVFFEMQNVKVDDDTGLYGAGQAATRIVEALLNL